MAGGPEHSPARNLVHCRFKSATQCTFVTLEGVQDSDGN